MTTIFATKRATHQAWTATGRRIPVTLLRAGDNVVMVKSDTEQYLAFGKKKMKNVTKPEAGNLKKAGLSFGVKLIRKVTGLDERAVGDTIVPSSVFKPGDMVKVTGTSKGMGFAGVVKRHGFKGGPRTHGQSDRERAPGASSSGTQLGHLWRGKRMAGRGGNKTVTVENLQIVAVNDDNGEILVKGVVPGAINATVQITKVAEGTFAGLFVREQKSVVKVPEQIVEEKPAKEAEKKEELKK